ncbi:Fasciclin-like arabinogalactan protein 3 [Glycine soja]
MDFKNSSLLCLTLFLACSSAIRAFDITQLLGQYPEFSTFNKYLTETKLADQINSRNTITVLAVEDSAMHSIAAKSPEAIKAIIGTHVILDFFDEKKLMEAQASSQQLTTLFQASGLAVNQQGFLKVALVGEGEIAFGSAASDAPADATELVRTVTSEPYNISILQVTKPILAPGVDSPTPASSSGAQPSQGAKAPIAAQSAKAPVAAQEAKTPMPSSQGVNAKAPVQAQVAKSPVPAQSAKAPTPLENAASSSPASESVAESPEVAAEAPATSPVGAEAPGPLADDVAPADVTASSASTTKMGLVWALNDLVLFPHTTHPHIPTSLGVTTNTTIIVTIDATDITTTTTIVSLSQSLSSRLILPLSPSPPSTSSSPSLVPPYHH